MVVLVEGLIITKAKLLGRILKHSREFFCSDLGFRALFYEGFLLFHWGCTE